MAKLTKQQASAAFESFIEGTPPPQAPPAEEAPGSDPLVDELRGELPTDPDSAPADPGSEGNPDAPSAFDTPGEILTKLQRAQKDAGKAGERLHQAREKLSEKDQQIALLEQRLSALESGAPDPAQPQQPSSVSLSDAQLDDFMASFDKNWAESREDPYKKDAAKYAAEMTLTLWQQMQSQLTQVQGGVLDMQFNGRLESLGISRTQFDALWKEPGYAWGESLTPEQRLAALESQAMTMGHLPSNPAPAVPPRGHGAHPTSSVTPRTIETTQGASSVQNPMTLRTMDLRRAQESGDKAAAKRAATPLWEQFINGR